MRRSATSTTSSPTFPGAKVILLEQNYRSTQTILNAANAVITRNENRKPKNLWSDAGDGEQLVGYVADTEHDEAQFVAAEIKRLNEDGGHRYGDAAVFYRTNAQSRAFEEAFIRAGMPYKVVGGVRFYERREVRDAIAYLRAIANRADDVSLRRILNVPKRGIGDRAEAAVADLATREGISFGDALRRVDEIPGLASRSANQLKAFAKFLDDHEAMVAEGMPADAILTSVLDRSGYLAELHDSTDPQDETRLENLKELITVAREFVTGVATLTVPEEELDDLGLPGESDAADPEGDLATALDPEADLAAGAAEPDASLGAFLERVALVADSDQIPRCSGRGRCRCRHLDDPAHGERSGVRHGLPHRLRRRRLPSSASDRGAHRQRAGGGTAARVRRHHPRPQAPLHFPSYRQVVVGLSPAQSAKSVPQRAAEPARSTGGEPKLRSRAGETPRRPATQTWRNPVGYGAKPTSPRDPIAGGWRQGAAHHVRHGHGCRNLRRRRQGDGRCGLWVLRTQAAVPAICTAGEALAGLKALRPSRGLTAVRR